MNRILALILIAVFMQTCAEPRPNYATFEEYPLYPYPDLGLSYSPTSSVVKLWSPAAEAARLLIYASGTASEPPKKTVKMHLQDGVWAAKVAGDLNGQFYTLQIKQQGKWLAEAADPYARAVSTNGLRTQIIDLKTTNPPDWEKDQRPPLVHSTDIVLYELHVRDASQSPSAGITQAGKFLGLTELGTKNPEGLSTGLDHLKELGVTHVHLLPCFDFMSVDESKPDLPQYNWGYDPDNYNVPEGSYATNVTDGAVRIREFKQLVQALHQQGLRVVMDVVYNHTGKVDDHKFELLTPGYFFRQNTDGSRSNASGCGNEVASERPMVRKYIRESVQYWVQEYHIDGFRFDLMGIHDIATMNDISASLQAIDSSLFVYGEGWTAGDSPLPVNLRALKANTPNLNHIAAFSDDLRDALKGSVFKHEETGFVSGKAGLAQSLRFGIVAATEHPQVDYAAVNYSKAPWASQPSQCINYASCHDNHTLWDRLTISNPQASLAQREAMHRLALAVVLTSQGVPFLHAGTEMLRTKNGEENSYRSVDAINAIDWKQKTTHHKTFEYVRGLIALRHSHPAFRLRSTQSIQTHLKFIDTQDDLLVAYTLKGVPGEQWQDILVAFNGSSQTKTLALATGDWTQVVNGDAVAPAGLNLSPLRNKLVLPPHTAAVLMR
ncbi:MAG: type I pullulanase [Lewinella sp.]|nr:type I pullulanase [Lewinella sp.]